jgi:outer membrane biosynthesis protein TonB
VTFDEVSPPNRDGPGFLDKLKALVSGAPTNDEFDPIAVGNEIKSHLDQADKAVAANREHSVAAGALLLDVQENHPGDMDAICERIGLGLSRRKELIMIAGGRKTLEQSRAENAERQRRHKNKKKKQKQAEQKQDPTPKQEPGPEPTAEPTAAPEPTEPLPGSVTADEFEEPRAANDPTPSVSKRALAEFTVACRTWLPRMDDGDRAAAIQICNEWRGREAA